MRFTYTSCMPGFDVGRPMFAMPRVSMIRSVCALVLLAGLGVACDRDKPSSDDDDDSRRSKKTRRADDDDGAPARDDRKVLKELRSWIQQAQEAVYVEGDAASYWRIYAREGQVITARGEQPHPYDFVIPAKRAMEFMEIRDKVGKTPPLEGYQQSHEIISEKMDGERVVFRWNVDTSWMTDGGKQRALFGERYTVVRQSDDGEERWRVAEKRSWIVSSTRVVAVSMRS